MDPSGAVIPRATVLVQPQPSGASQTIATDAEGRYQVETLPPGAYKVTSWADGFQPVDHDVVIAAGGLTVTLDIRLAIAGESQQVVVHETAPHLEVTPQSNATAVVVTGKSLDALSNDPDELASQLQALAGPAVGPDGGEIYIDGFTAGDMPPKSAIRSIRVNSNPFSAINDRLGYGRIDVYTKPGADNYHGSVSAEYNDVRMNALSKFLADSSQPLPAYHTWLMDANLGGPAGKNTSFYFAFQRRNIDRANLVNTDILDSNYNIVPYVDSVDNPRILTDVDPRVDFQLGPKNTVSLNYEYFQVRENNDGVNTQSLPSTAYNAVSRHHSLRIMDNQILSANVVNETHFQYLHFHNSQVPQNFDPTINVIGAFTGGGDDGGNYDRFESHYELQNFVTLTHGKHMLQFGGFFRDIRRSEDTNGGFNGTFTFNSIANYQQTQQALRQGQTMAQIQAAGYGPSQFTITGGKLEDEINRVDAALFVGDDWKILPSFTLSYGLRFETQNGISDHADWAPRLGFAWGLGGANPKTVVRAGWGMFYERYDDDQMIITARLNGTNQLSYLVKSPKFFPTPPPFSSFSASAQSAPTIYQVSPNLRSPYDMDLAASVERQVAKEATASLTYLYSRGEREFLSNDINAPLPGTYNPADPTSGTRPLGNAAGNIYQYQSEGIFRQTQLITNVHVSAGDNLSVFGYYVLNNSHGDSNGVDSFPSNPWNLMQDYGRAAFDIRSRATVGGTASLQLALRLSAMLIASSGRPFTIFLPQDLYGAGIHNARPSLATSSTPAADVAVTPYGSFNLAPSSTGTPIPPNTVTGPSNVMLNLRASRTFGFGTEGRKAHGGEATAAGPPEQRHARGLGGRGLGGGGSFGLGGATDRRYALTFSVSALNALNSVNLATPVSTLGSPLFGQSISLAGGPYSAQIGNPVANRLVSVNLAFSF
jgi:Carboxypeptidase regulatory-like domain